MLSNYIFFACFLAPGACLSTVEPDTYLLPLSYSHSLYNFKAGSSFDFDQDDQLDDTKWTMLGGVEDDPDGVNLHSIPPNPDKSLLRNEVAVRAQAWRMELTVFATHSPITSGEYSYFGIIFNNAATPAQLGTTQNTITDYSGLSFWIELRPGGSVAGYFNTTLIPTFSPVGTSSLSACSACAIPSSGLPYQIRIAIQSVDDRVTLSATATNQLLPSYCFSKNRIIGMMEMAATDGFQLALAALNSHQGTIKVSKLDFFELDPQIAPAVVPQEPDTYLLQIPYAATFQDDVSLNPTKHANASGSYKYTLSGTAKITPDNNATLLAGIGTDKEGGIVSTNIAPNCPNFRVEMKLMVNDFSLTTGDGIKLVVAFLEASQAPKNLYPIFATSTMTSLHGFFLSINLGYYPSTLVLFAENLVFNLNASSALLSCQASLETEYGADNFHPWAKLGFQVVGDYFTLALKFHDMPTICYSNAPIPSLGRFMQQQIAKIQIGQMNGGNTGSVSLSEFKYWCLESTSSTSSTLSTSSTSPTSPASSTSSTSLASSKTSIATQSTSPTTLLPVTVPSTVQTVIAEPAYLAQLKTIDPENNFPTLITGNAIPEIELHDLTSCRNIQPSVRAPNPDNSTQVSLTFSIERLLDIDDIGETIAIAGSIYLQWQVKTCSENTTAFGASDAERVIITNADDVWHPNLIFANSSDDPYLQSTHFGSDMQIMFFPTRPYRELFFYWTQVGVLKSTCELDLRKFPFDEQTCDFTFLLNEPVNFVMFEDVRIKTPILSPNNQWQLSKSTHETGETVSTIARNGISSYSLVRLHFARNPAYQVGNLVAPCLILLAIVYGSFIMPPDDANRPVISVTILLAFTVAQSQVTSQVPKTSQRILLSEYVMFFIGLTSAITLYQMVTIWLCKNIEAAQNTYELFSDWRHSPSMSGARAIDLGFFLIAFDLFIGINLYMLAVVW